MIRKFSLVFAIALAACAAPTAQPGEDTGTEAEPLLANLGALPELGLCLDVAGFNNNNGYDTLEMWDCNGRINQQWAYDTVTHRIVSKWNGKCLENLENNGYSVGMWDCHDGISEKWRPSANGRLVHEGDGKCLRRQWWHHMTRSEAGYYYRVFTAVFLADCNAPETATWATWSWDWWNL